MSALLALAGALSMAEPLALIAADSPADHVTVREAQLWILHGTSTARATEPLVFPGEIRVQTNGTFQVAAGKSRSLSEGQILSADGLLFSPDGSIVPVFDHVTLTRGQPTLVRDGEVSRLTTDFRLADGAGLSANGMFTSRTGHRRRMLDGEWFKLDGSSLAARDTATLREGRVVLQKDGSMIPLRPSQVMMMSEGTRVRGDGMIQSTDGSKFNLREGETLLVEGVYVRPR